LGYEPLKSQSKSAEHLLLLRPKSSFGRDKFQPEFVVDSFDEFYAPQKKILEGLTKDEIYPSQTKILENRTNLSECVFEALFKVVSTRFGIRFVEECFEDVFGTVGSAFQNLRLGSIKSRFSTDFSMVRSPNRVLTPWKSASKIRIASFVPPSKIFVWEG
jgi:hypothetical protein